MNEYQVTLLDGNGDRIWVWTVDAMRETDALLAIFEMLAVGACGTFVLNVTETFGFVDRSDLVQLTANIWG